MCKYVILLFLSVNSWRCVFYVFAFVYGILALYDVSGVIITVTVSITGFVSCVSFSITQIVCFAAVGDLFSPYFVFLSPLPLSLSLWPYQSGFDVMQSMRSSSPRSSYLTSLCA